MIRVLSIPGCPLCRKAKTWLKEEGLPVENENFYSFLLDDARVLQFAKIYRNWLLLKMKDVPGIQNWKNDRLARFLQENPSRLPRPIILAKKEPPQIQRKLLCHFMGITAAGCPASCTIQNACRKVRENDRALLILNGRIMRPMDPEDWKKNCQNCSPERKPAARAPAPAENQNIPDV